MDARLQCYQPGMYPTPSDVGFPCWLLCYKDPALCSERGSANAAALKAAGHLGLLITRAKAVSFLAVF